MIHKRLDVLRSLKVESAGCYLNKLIFLPAWSVVKPCLDAGEGVDSLAAHVFGRRVGERKRCVNVLDVKMTPTFQVICNIVDFPTAPNC